MRKIREALRLHYDAGLGVRAISRSLKASPSTVREYLVRAKLQGLTWPLPESLDDAALLQRLYRASGATPTTLTWVVFASLLIAGAVTALQAFPIRRLGAGYVLVTGTTAAAIAVSVDALRAGGPGLLAALMIVTALFQLVCSLRISMFRRILTPTVSGTVLMLVPVTIAPIIFGKISDVPAGFPPSSGGVCALVTLVLIVFVAVKGYRRLRPWAPIVGIVGGAVVAALYGMYDMDRVAQSPWIGLPSPAWPAFKNDLGSSFWGLLPAFLLVSMSCTIRTKSASLAIQDVSWRLPRAPDLRAVQGAVAAEAFANLLAAVGGTVLHGVRSTTVSLTQITRVGARRVGLGRPRASNAASLPWGRGYRLGAATEFRSTSSHSSFVKANESSCLTGG